MDLILKNDNPGCTRAGFLSFSDWDAADDEAALARLSASRREAVLASSVPSVRRQRAAAGLLLETLLREAGAREPFLYRRTKTGRPYLENGPFFSISHTEDAAVASVSRLPVGIDLESRLRPLSGERLAGLAGKFAPGTRDHILNAEDPAGAFLLHWTAAEAIGKAAGDGVLSVLGLIPALDTLPIPSGMPSDRTPQSQAVRPLARSSSEVFSAGFLRLSLSGPEHGTFLLSAVSVPEPFLCTLAVQGV